MREMKVRSIYIEKDLWEKVSKLAGKHSISMIISMLLEKWIDGEIKLVIEPFNEENDTKN